MGVFVCVCVCVCVRVCLPSFSFNIALLVCATWAQEMGLYIGPGSQAFLKAWGEFAHGKFFYSHLSDYLRFTLLYFFGGTYLDADAVLLRPLPVESFVGIAGEGAPPASRRVAWDAVAQRTSEGSRVQASGTSIRASPACRCACTPRYGSAWAVGTTTWRRASCA